MAWNEWEYFQMFVHNCAFVLCRHIKLESKAAVITVFVKDQKFKTHVLLFI